ncbi:uncharacterized protein LOC132919757 [Rhopalosiphum padi]|uniref:uncharacterized protein LOC132919757 n=1 Tax=Rhopalosiphum padi TaxID=40932 RepID=UPI00298EC28E|nr:uncharacterized protein LOC132919757 [Rhopalosiphum padi]
MITEITTGSVLPNTVGGKIKRPSFKSRNGAGSHVNRTGSFRGYQTIRVSVPSSMVAELASKFNAVVVDANQGDSMQDIMKKVSKTLAKGATVRTKVTAVREKGVVVRATVEKFESTSQKKRCMNQMVVVRTNSNQRSVEERPTAVVQRRGADHQTAAENFTAAKQPSAAEQRREVQDHRTAVKQPIAVELPTDVENRETTDILTAAEQPTTPHPTTPDDRTVEQRKTMDPRSSSSVVKKLLVQFENGKKPSKPSVLGPKPNVTTPGVRRNERRPPLQKDTISAVDRHLLNKDKRLSIARDPDAQLESVLNATPSPKNLLQPTERERSPPPRKDSEQQQLSTETDRSTPQKDLKHQQPIETDRSPTRAVLQQPTVTTTTKSPPPLPLKPNCSFLHGWKRPLTATSNAATSTTAATTTLATTALDITTPISTVNHYVAATPAVANTSTTITSVATTTTDHQGGPHSRVGEECSSQPSLTLGGVATPTTSALASLAEATLTVTAFATDTTATSAHTTTIVTDTTAITTETCSHDYNYIVNGESIYEELRYNRLTSTDYVVTGNTEAQLSNVMVESPYIVDCLNDDHYTTIDGGEHNIYDVVTTAATNVYEDDSYETVQPPLPPLPPPPPPPVVSVTVADMSPLQLSVEGDGDENGVQGKKEMFDNSVEIDNSIYGINPPSESTSSGVTSDSISVDRNSKFDEDDGWVDVPSSEEIILIPYPSNRFRQKPKIKKPKKPFSKLIHGLLNKDHNTGNTINQEIPENIYVFDSFSSDNYSDDDGENVKRVPEYPCKDRVLPAPPSDERNYGIGPLVNKARKRFKKGWSFGSLRSLGIKQIGKLSQGNLTADFDNRTYESTSDKSIDKSFNSLANSNSPSSSVFYIPIYKHIIGNGEIRPIRNRSKPPSSIDSRRLSVARPSSPPPPPPVKRHSTGNTTYGSLPRSIYNSKGRPVISLDKSSTESTSENGSNHGSDLYMRFADEPLYQFYAADITERTKSVFAGDIMEECDGYEEISSITSRPSALELITPCTSGHGQHRSLWCEVPEVKNSGIIDSLTPRERKLQEAKFELITSEASYFKSLTVLEKHFINSHSMNDDTILSKKDQKILFGNVNPVRKCSEKLLAALEKCWQDNILLSGLSEILYTHSKENFDIFVKYCSNQIYIDRTLKSLRENQKFNEALQRLESDPKCQSLSLHSFLMLPMQRITRLPLLVDAILSQMDSKENSLEYQMCELTLASLNAIVQNCNESTRKLERYEEMLLLSQQLEFSSKKEMKAMSVASSSRWLVRSGSMLHLTGPDAKLTFSRKLIRPTKLYFFLFNDMFFIAKRKSDGNYTVIDYCARNFVEMEHATELIIPSSYKNLLKLTILENHEGKTVEMLLSCDSESSKKRWIEAMSPPISSNPEETLYNEWDCPQVFSEHPYTAIQPDELSLQNGDIVKVLTKMNDGWYHGERIRDGEKGWFPGNYTSEIASQHARAKNLKQRYRLLAMSGSYLQSRQDKIKKKKSSQII